MCVVVFVLQVKNRLKREKSNLNKHTKKRTATQRSFTLAQNQEEIYRGFSDTIYSKEKHLNPMCMYFFCSGENKS